MTVNALRNMRHKSPTAVGNGASVADGTGLRRFKAVLENILIELQRTPGRLDDIVIQAVADSLDQGKDIVDHEVAIQRLEYGCSRSRQIKAALRRIDGGTYGVCVECESDITVKRLKAVPWTPYCLKCQDVVDRSLNQRAESVLIEMHG